jgi:hypothetical protein
MLWADLTAAGASPHMFGGAARSPAGGPAPPPPPELAGGVLASGDVPL